MTNLEELLAKQKFYQDLVEQAKKFKKDMFSWGVVRKNMEKVRNHVNQLSKSMQDQKELFKSQERLLEQINDRIDNGEANPEMSLKVDELCAKIDAILDVIEDIREQCLFYNNTKAIFVKGFCNEPWSDERIKDNIGLNFTEYGGELTSDIIELAVFYEWAHCFIYVKNEEGKRMLKTTGGTKYVGSAVVDNFFEYIQTPLYLDLMHKGRAARIKELQATDLANAPLPELFVDLDTTNYSGSRVRVSQKIAEAKTRKDVEDILNVDVKSTVKVTNSHEAITIA